MQELGVSNIDRCKGFTEHLMSLVQKQWKCLATNFARFHKLREMYDAIARLNSEERNSAYMPPQADAAKRLVITICLFQMFALLV